MLPGPRAFWQCLRLNCRVAQLALGHRWLGRAEVARSYDRLAPHYDTAWQRHLRPVTDTLLARLTELPTGRILDLGCGTGYATALLAARFPDASVTAVDLSAGMLAAARKRVRSTRVDFVHGDMLEQLAAQSASSAALVFSAWALGYSRPAQVVTEAARVLKPGGVLAFVVNYADTLAPVFRAFRRCMAEHVDHVRLAAWLRFPKDWPRLETTLRRQDFTLVWHEDGHQPIKPPALALGARLPWLLRTGVLAGFDAMLPLAEPGPVAEQFEHFLQLDPEPIQHHYAAAVARRP